MNALFSINKSRILSILILLSGIFLSFIFLFILKNFEKKSAEIKFNQIVQKEILPLYMILERDMEILYSMASLFDSSEFVSRNEFKEFTKGLLKRHPEIQSLEWIPAVSKNKLNDFKTLYGANLTPNFEVFNQDKKGNISIPQDDLLFPLLYTEPFENNKIVIGKNYGGTSCLPQLEKSLQENKAVSCTHSLARLNQKVAGTFIFYPVFQKGSRVSTEENKKQYLEGFVGILLRADFLFKEAFKNSPPYLDIHISELENKESKLIFEKGRGLKEDFNTMRKNIFFDVGDLNWHITLHTGYYNLVNNNSYPYLLFILSILFSILVAYLYYFSSKQKENIQQEVEQKTLYLKQEINERQKTEEKLKLSNQFLEAANKNIQLKANELERFNKIMLDREERIIELKEQLKTKVKD